MTVFTGVWNVTIDTLVGKIEAVFDITEVDGTIHGIARTDAETSEFVDAVATGDQLTWTQAVTTPMKLTLKFDVTIEGDTMTGTSKAGIFPASKVTGTRSTAS
jgi:isocitrate lyase